MKILVTGANGQLGSELNKLSENSSFEWTFTDIKELNLLDLENIPANLDAYFPDVIINCAAYTAVDKAEEDTELSDILNHKAISVIAKWSFKNSCKLLHVSTEYVFDGNSEIPLTEKAITNPINVYGETKLLGETRCLKNNPNAIIIRTAWVYSSFAANFVKTMMCLMQEKEKLNIINDQIGSPTYAADLAGAILKIIASKKWIPGIYHYSNEGEISWFDFANDIKELGGFKTEINGIPTKEYPTPAKRPKYSLLDKTKIKETYHIEIPYYRDSLEKCIKILKNEK
jgi:dTDP-4-dehydrorhamnose reductase